MRLFHRSEHPPIGLEIGPGGVRLLQLLPGEPGVPAVVMAHHEWPAGAPANAAVDLRSAVACARTLLSEGPFVGRRIVAAIPDEFVQLRTLRLPAVEDEGVPGDEVVRREARLAFGPELASAHLQFLHAGKVRNGFELRHEVLAACCLSGRLEALAEELDRTGLKLVSADIAPCAAYRGIESVSPRRDAVHAILELGEERARVLIGQGPRIRFIKTIPQGTKQLREAVGRRLGISADEAGELRRRLAARDTTGAGERDPVRRAVWQSCRAILESLAEEVVLCLRYYRVSFGGVQPDALVLTGSDAGDPHLGAVLAGSTGLPASPAFPLRGFDLSRVAPQDRQLPCSEWAVPLGLALRGNSGIVVPALPATLAA